MLSNVFFPMFLPGMIETQHTQSPSCPVVMLIHVEIAWENYIHQHAAQLLRHSKLASPKIDANITKLRLSLEAHGKDSGQISGACANPRRDCLNRKLKQQSNSTTFYVDNRVLELTLTCCPDSPFSSEFIAVRLQSALSFSLPVFIGQSGARAQNSTTSFMLLTWTLIA